VGGPLAEVQRAAPSAVQIDLQAGWRLVLILQAQSTPVAACHKGGSVTDSEIPASDVHTEMRLTHLEEGFTAQQTSQEGIDLGERIADLGGPQIGSR
jgi:hypothetical protein